MTKVQKRLATIKYCLVMNDLEILDIQIGLLYQLELDVSTDHILTLLKKAQYQEAINKISDYLESSQSGEKLIVYPGYHAKKDQDLYDWRLSRIDNDWVFRFMDWVCRNSPHWSDPIFTEQAWEGVKRTLYWYTIPVDKYQELHQEIYGDLTGKDLCPDCLIDETLPECDRYTEIQRCHGATDANIRSKYYQSLIEIDLTIFSSPQGAGFGDISCIPPEIGRFVNLERLVLPGGVLLGGIPIEINQLNNLTEITLEIWLEGQTKNEWLPKVIADIANISSLKKLYIDSKCSLNIPPEIGRLVNLKELDISVHMDEISTDKLILPAEIGSMINLTKLSISGGGEGFMSFEAAEGGIYDYTGIDISLPSEIGQLECLTELSLCGLPFSKLPFEIGKLSNLRKLNLHGLDLSELPSSLGQLMKLEKLSVSDNHLSGLPQELVRLSNLTELTIREDLSDSSVLERLYQLNPHLK